MFQQRKSIAITPYSTSLHFNSSILGTSVLSDTVTRTFNNTNQYNMEYQAFANDLINQKQAAQDLLSSLPPGDTSLRHRGVDLAWKYENAEVTLGGNGSTNWTEAQREEILESLNGRVRGAEAHHINSVKAAPEQQADPNNIEFVKNREEHLQKHNGDYRNETRGELLDREQRLKDVNNERVYTNEWKGIGLAAAVGLGIGFSIGVIATLAQNGITTENVKTAIVNGGKSAVESSVISTVNYALVRGIQELYVFLNLTLTDHLMKILNMSTIGIISTVLFSSWLYIKLKRQGKSSKDSLVLSLKAAGVSLTVLFISILAQAIWGGPAGIIASISIGISIATLNFLKRYWDKNTLKELQLFSINCTRPTFN